MFLEPPPSPAPAVALVRAAARPALIGVAPRPAPSDTADARYARATFSPGHGRDGPLSIRVAARPGTTLRFLVRRVSQRQVVYRSPQVAVGESGVAILRWRGQDARGRALQDQSVTLQVCASAGPCTLRRALVHIRRLSAWVPSLRSVAVGSRVPLVVATERPSVSVSLVPAWNVRAPPAGRWTARAGTRSIVIPRVPEGGLWLLRVDDGAGAVRFVPLIVRDPRWSLRRPPVGTPLVVFPLVTWRAYNGADTNRDGRADSWYAHPDDPVVPSYGPYENVGQLGWWPAARRQVAFVRWFHAHELRAQFVTDVDLARLRPSTLESYPVIVFAGHHEYYERRQYDLVMDYNRAGGRLLYLQANGFFGKVRVGERTIRRLTWPLGIGTRYDYRIAGSGLRKCCWPKSRHYHYRLRAGIVARLPWLFAGTGLADGDRFGEPIQEVNAVRRGQSPRGTIIVASARVIDRIRVDIAYVPAHDRRGEIFDWGSVGFMEQLQGRFLPAGERTALDRAALNVWERLRRPDVVRSRDRRSLSSAARPVAVLDTGAGYRLAGFAIDAGYVATADDGLRGRCPRVRFRAVAQGPVVRLGTDTGPTCRFGGYFWSRPNARPIGLALRRALWVMAAGRPARKAIAVKASVSEPEVVLRRAAGIDGRRGPFFGPVAASNWLRVFGRYRQTWLPAGCSPGAAGCVRGPVVGEVISGNNRVLWKGAGPIVPQGNDDERLALVARDGSVRVVHAHGYRLAYLPNAHARAVADQGERLVVLRADVPRLDVYTIEGRKLASWPVPSGVRPLLDVHGSEAVFTVGHAVHALDIATGSDRTVAIAPRGTSLIDAQVERSYLAYAYRFPSGRGRLVVLSNP